MPVPFGLAHGGMEHFRQRSTLRQATCLNRPALAIQFSHQNPPPNASACGKKPPRGAAEGITHQNHRFPWYVMEEAVDTVSQELFGERHRDTHSENIVFNRVVVVSNAVYLVLQADPAVETLGQT